MLLVGIFLFSSCSYEGIESGEQDKADSNQKKQE
jgi:hypothetical protein